MFKPTRPVHVLLTAGLLGCYALGFTLGAPVSSGVQAGSETASAAEPAYLPLVMQSGGPARPRPSVEIDLGGTWQLAQSADPNALPEDGWTDVQVPSFVDWNEESPHLWFRRTVRVSEGFPRKWVYLRFEGVKFRCRVFLNGSQLALHTDGFVPFEVSVPPELLFDENELVVQVDGWPSLLAPEADAANVGSADEIEDGFLYAMGSHERQVGIWQPVSLVGGTGVRITDVHVRTSVRPQTLALDVTLYNRTGSAQQVILENEVMREGVRVHGLRSAAVTLERGEQKTVSLTSDWPSAQLWTPETPVLYELHSRLDGGEYRRTRFGFREVRVDGNRILLNGIPIRLRGTATHPASFMNSNLLSIETARRYLQVAKDGNNIAFRLHAQPWPQAWYDAADEIGILLVWESAYWCNPRSYRLEGPRFWANFREHLSGQLLLHRNHPSVVIWSLENELLLCSGTEPAATPRMEYAERELAALVDHVREYDPDRPIMFDGDADPGGRADIVNLHYPHEYPRWSDWPNEAWWLDQTTATDIYPGRIDGWPLSKPLYIGEFAWVPPAWIEGASIFFGDAIYGDPSYYYRRGKAASWIPQIEAYRCLGVQGLCPWNIWEGADDTPNPELYAIVKEKYAPHALFLREKNQRLFVDAPIKRTAQLFNDSLSAKTLSAKWQLRVDRGDQRWQSRQFRLQPASSVTFTLGFDPAEARDALARRNAGAIEGALAVQVKEGPEIVFADQPPVTLHTREPLSSPIVVDLYDPESAVAPSFTREGIGFRTITALARLADEAQVLLIGRGGIATAADWRQVVEFARGGGRALVLAQDGYPAGVPLHLMAESATISFARETAHPALEGVGDGDLRYWAPDNVVIRRSLARPDLGTYRVLIDAGSANGLTRVGLLEMPIGAGTVMASQLDLVARLEEEPAARQLLQGLLDYLAAYEHREPGRFAAVGTSSAQRAMLTAIGFDMSALPSAPGEADVILVGPELQPGAFGDLLLAARSGATLWLHKPTLETRRALDQASLPIRVRESVPGLVTLAPDLRAPGLTDYSLFWSEGRATRAGAMPPLAHDFAPAVYSRRMDWTSALTIDPDSFEVSAAAAYVGEDRVSLYTNGSIAASFEVPTDGDYDVGMQAQGTPVEDEYPLVRFQVDDQPPTIVAVGELDVYGVPAELSAGEHRIRLEFFNDRWEPPEDRNLTVFRLLVAPAVAAEAWQPLTHPASMVEAEYGSGRIVVDSLNWDEPGATLRKQELVVGLLRHWGVRLPPPSFAWTLEAETMEVESGALVTRRDNGVWFASHGTIGGNLVVPAAGQYVVRVLAAGTPVGGVYPDFEVAIDGVVVGRGAVASGSAAYYEIDAVLQSGERHLTLSFVNDAYDPPEDRNLFVDRIVVVDR